MIGLTAPQRRALNLAARRPGVPADNIPPATSELLIACDLITEHDYSNDGTWTLKITAAGRALLNPPAVHVRESPRLMHGAWMPHPDPTVKRSVPEPEMVDAAYQERFSRDALPFRAGRQGERASEQAAKRDARARSRRRAA